MFDVFTLQPELKGVITLEDVIEELIGEEIVDETDRYIDVHRRTVVARAKLAFQRQSCSADQSLSSRPRLGLPESRPRSWSANVPQSPGSDRQLTEEEVFGQQLYIEAEVEVNNERIVLLKYSQFRLETSLTPGWASMSLFLA